ncbi:hypothetical protein ACFQD2_01380 [Pseudomonas lini]
MSELYRPKLDFEGVSISSQRQVGINTYLNHQAAFFQIEKRGVGLDNSESSNI